MRRSFPWLVAAVLACVFCFGFAGRRISDRRLAAEGAPRASLDADQSRLGPGHGRQTLADSIRPPGSTDRVEDLLALDGPELYSRLALWVVDAGVKDLERFWEGYGKRKTANADVLRLVLGRWTRLDPRGALQAVEGSSSERIFWWAWGMNDPDAAMAEVLDRDWDFGAMVMLAIGEFQPDRSLAFAEQHPRFLNSIVVQQIAEGLGDTDPEAALKLLKKHDCGGIQSLIETWTRNDPAAAFDWALRNGPVGASNTDSIVNQLIEENPEALRKIVEEMPQGSERRKVEAMLFSRLAKEDPEAALAEARQAQSDLLKAERLALVGKEIAADDPEQAFALLTEVLEICSSPFGRPLRQMHPDASSTRRERIDGVGLLLSLLMKQEPQRTMDVFGLMLADETTTSGDFVEAGRSWMRHDLDGFSEWVNAQPAGQAWDLGARIIAQEIVDEDPAMAMEWVMGVGDEEGRGTSAYHTLAAWKRIDREAAQAWYLGTDMPAALRRKLRSHFPGVQ